MTVGFTLAFLALLVVNTWIGRSILYPPALFSGAWVGYMAALYMASDRFFPVSDGTLLLFLGGAMAMTVGGLLVLLIQPSHSGGPRHAASRSHAAIQRLLGVASLLIVAALPLRILRLSELAGGKPLDLASASFWISARKAAIVESDEGGLSWLTLSDNVVLLALFVALATLAEDVQRKRLRLQTVVVMALALLYQVSTASRSSAMCLVCGLIGVAWLASGRWSFRSAILGSLGAVFAFSAAAVLLNKGGRLDESLAENIPSVSQMAMFYAVGPLVAFENAFQNPGDIPPVWSIGYSVLQLVSKLGLGVPAPALHAEYSQVAPAEWMNVYTMYFAYVPSFGVPGALLLTALVGAGLTWLFRHARAGDPRARLVYATAVSAILLSGFNEQFFMSLTFYAKAAVFSIVVYGLPPIPVRAQRQVALVTKKVPA